MQPGMQWVLVLALLGSAAAIDSALAYECKSKVSASSGVRGSPGHPPPSLRSAACKRAITKWEAVVAQRYGARFADWTASQSRHQRFWFTATHGMCEASAEPCTPLE